MDTGILSVDKFSMMTATPAYSVGGEVVFGLRATVLPPNDVTDRVITTEPRHEGRPDILAYELYGDVKLWWVVPEANQMVDPVVELKSGMDLRVPSKARVLNNLSA